MTAQRQSLCAYFGVLLCFVIAGVSLTSCGYLIKPKLKTGIVNLEKGSYRTDPQHTSVLFKIEHMGMSTFVGRFDRVDASLEFDPQHMADAKLSAIITIASIDVNNQELAETLRGSSWFAAEQFPQALFHTTSVQLLDDKHATFTGSMTLHGVTAPIALEVIFNGGGDNLLTGRYTLGFTAHAHFKRSTFGIDYLVPAISDDVDVEVFTEFQKHE